jgi:positive regulator of sigma E activity
MQEKGMVTQISNTVITVIPLITDACLSCTAGCAKQGKSFEVSNPLHLPVEKGSIVKIGTSKKAQNLQGIIALLFPFLCAVAGYFCAPSIASLFNKEAGDGLRAIFVLFFLLLSSLFVFLLSKFHPFAGKPEIQSLY